MTDAADTLATQGVSCPLCHALGPLSAAAVAAGEYWRCARCAQEWDGERLSGFRAYAAWVAAREAAIALAETPPIAASAPLPRPGAATRP